MESRFLKCKKTTERDEEYVFAYRLTWSQTEAAEMCGVSRETIARAVRRAGLQLTGRKNSRSRATSWNRKITDEELKTDAKELTVLEIAKKYDISEENLYRRAKKIGIKLNHQALGGHWKRRAIRYGCKEFDNTITLKSLIERDKGICQICGQPVDATDIQRGHVMRKYPSLDHIVPLSKGGTHTWDNVQLAHMGCNSGKCDKLRYVIKKEA